jgi:hypothetical protein
VTVVKSTTYNFVERLKLLCTVKLHCHGGIYASMAFVLMPALYAVLLRIAAKHVFAARRAIYCRTCVCYERATHILSLLPLLLL